MQLSQDGVVKAAIVGCGNIGNRHAQAYADLGGSALVGVADIIVERAEDYAHRYGSTAYASAAELVAATQPELVSVCTPPGTHTAIVIELLAAGCSVLVEKPPVLSLAEMDAIAAAEQKSAGSVYVVFQHRHGSGAVRAHRLLREGALGEPQVAVCETLWFRPRAYFDPEWRGTWSGEGGGPTLGHGIHQIDLLLHLLGPWRTLQATAVRLDRPVEFEDVSMATVRLESGAVASVVNSLLSPRELSRIRVDTTEGTLEVDHVYGYADDDWSYFSLSERDRRLAASAWAPDGEQEQRQKGTEHDPWAASAGDDVPSSHRAQITRLVADLLDGRTHETTLASTRATMEFVTALYASAIGGQPVARTDLVPGHPFYGALHGHIGGDELRAAFAF